MAHTSFTITTDVVMEQNAASSLTETLKDVVREYILFAVTDADDIKKLSGTFEIVPSKTIYKIKYDESPCDPTHDDWGCIFYCNHGRYTLGHKNAASPWIEDNPNNETRSDIKYILNVYMYEHSSITISTTPFGCRWDSGLIGAIYMTEESMADKCGVEFENPKEAYDYMRSFIKEKDCVIRSDCWYVEATDEEGAHLDSSFGFLGDITDDIYSEFPPEDRAAIEAAWENRFTN